MKIIVDDKIPYIKGQIEQLGSEVLYLSGAAISARDVKDADVLVVRTRTHCNRELLEGSRVRFIVTATIGFDHLDTVYLHEAGIEWTNCPGCNATSVGQYVRNTLFLLEREKGLCLREATLGIVGVGHVGTAVLEACRPYVGRVLLNDPPKVKRLAGELSSHRTIESSSHRTIESSSHRALESSNHQECYCDLSELQRECDVITFHTPLVKDGQWPTFHLADEAFFRALPRKPFLVNAARGEVVDNEALERALDEGCVRQAVIDTWEGEPRLSRTLLNKVYIGTPHVAGYSADGKANATRMSLQAVASWMGRHGLLPAPYDEEHLPTFLVEPPAVYDNEVGSGMDGNGIDGRGGGATDYDALVSKALRLYDPRTDSVRLKEAPEGFEKQRGNYPLRRECFAQ